MIAERTKEAYAAAFAAERERQYPAVDAVVEEFGYDIGRESLESAARVLACPLKVNPPNWQHGRVIYAVLRRYLQQRLRPHESVVCLDVGTAKGFSALCAAFALTDDGAQGVVHSVDVIDPMGRTDKRNTVADCDGPSTVPELLAQWPLAAARIALFQSTGVTWLRQTESIGRINFAFLDGKHRHAEVQSELAYLSQRQIKGDYCIADDVHLPGVLAAVTERGDYGTHLVDVLPNRRYAIMRKRG
jgi:cephalosporin hydroxylase